MTANEIMKSIKDNLDSVEHNLEQIQCDDCISEKDNILINKNNFLTTLVWSGLLDRAKCGELARAIDLCVVEQEPCDDCISRHKAIVAITACDGKSAQIEAIEKLPSVTPKQKTGHWIMSDDGLFSPICDKCGAHPWKGYIPTVEEATEVFKYCPNCGSKMEVSE